MFHLCFIQWLGTDISSILASCNCVVYSFQSYIIQDVAVNSSYSVSVALSNINGTGPLSQSVMGPSPEEGGEG